MIFSNKMMIIFFFTLCIIIKLSASSRVNRNYPLDNDEIRLSNDSRSRTSAFSGIYLPNVATSAEHYAGAWLTTKTRFMQCINEIRMMRNLEGGSFAILFQGVNVMTRDYFDFQLLHLSSTTNQLPTLGNDNLNNELLFRMKESANILKATNSIDSTLNIRRSNRDKRILRNTVVLIPFSTNPASLQFNPNQKKAVDLISELRIIYLKATIYSVHRYFPKIIVTVSADSDLNLVKSLDLPIWKYVNLTGKFTDKHLLPKYSLIYLYEKLNGHNYETIDEANEWRNIRYIYYTESDHILYAKHLSLLYNVLDKFNTTLSIVPHRMQSIALPSTFGKFEGLWRGHYLWPENKLNLLRNVDLVIEDGYSPKGSCCDDGRFRFGNCGNWWYNCPKYGLHNYTTWVRYGKDGFTLPFGTEHQAKCKYSSSKVLCPLPDKCERRLPKTMDDIVACQEIPSIVVVE